MALSESQVRLMTVYELIEASFPDITTNTVNFKIMQIVMHILANGLNILEQDVLIRFEDENYKLSKLQQDLTAIKDAIEEARRLKEEKKRKKAADAEGKTTPLLLNQCIPTTGTKTFRRQSYFIKLSSSFLYLALRRQLAARPPSIHLATASAFKLLEEMVNELLDKSGAVPLPTMPEPEKMLTEVASGTMSLTGTMEAMQLNARVQAAEEALTRMANLLISVADAGGLPPELASMVTSLKQDLRRLSALTGEKVDVAVGPDSAGDGEEAGESDGPRESAAKPAYARVKDMEEGLAVCAEKLALVLSTAVAKGAQTGGRIQVLAKKIGDNIKVAEKLEGRVTDLTSIADHNYEKLNGFADVLGGRMSEIDNQMNTIQACTTDAVKRLMSPDCDSEHNAMIALKIDYGTLLIEMGNAELAHNAVSKLKKQCDEDLQIIISVIGIMEDEKAVSEEVQAELNNKVSLLSLKGLLPDSEFKTVRGQLERSLNLCYDTFYALEDEWMGRLKQLATITEQKAQYRNVMELADYAKLNFNNQRKLIQILEKKLGTVEEAIRTRKISENGHCGPCMVPAHIAPTVERVRPSDPWPFDKGGPADLRRERSHRWVGGSHTLKARRRLDAAPPPPPHTTKYIGLADDGRLYHMEKELEPCVECLSPLTGRTCEDGGGDTAD